MLPKLTGDCSSWENVNCRAIDFWREKTGAMDVPNRVRWRRRVDDWRTMRKTAATKAARAEML
jgi:hypothetical protein